MPRQFERHHYEGYGERGLTDIRYIVVHHSGVAIESSVQAIRNWHQSNNGWPDIGYQFVIMWSGQVVQTMPITRVSFHVAGRNRESIGICIPGDWTRELPPQPALDSLVGLVDLLRSNLGRPVPVVGHGEHALPSNPSACPGRALATWVRETFQE